jgi:hypothetical protein
MKFQRKRGVSVIVATLLLVAISVAAAVIVYVFVGGLAGNLTQNGGQPVTERLIIQSFNFAISPGTCGCSMQLIEIFLLNPGPATTIINAVYYDGVLVTWGGVSLPLVGTPKTFAANSWFGTTSQSTLGGSTGPASYYFNASPAPGNQEQYSPTNTGQVVIGLASAASYGSGHTVKVVSTTGAAFVFTVVAGISG